MADLTITATQVLPVTDSTGIATGIAGATITAGQSLYLDATTSTLKLAQADGTAAEAAVVGVSLHAASAGQPISYATTGELTLGAGAAPANGTTYVVSAAAGGICPNADISTSTHRKSLVGTGIGSNKIKLHLVNTGGVIP